MTPETYPHETDHRLICLLRFWQDERDLTLVKYDDKIKASRTMTDDEREFILAYRPQLIKLIPKLSTMTKAECQPHLKAWWQAHKEKPYARQN